MRLIDADEPRKLIRDEMREAEELGTHDADVCKASLMMALSYIDTTLTIDAMPVVRCKECKHRAEWNGAYGCGLDGCFGDRYTDGFCDRAERRDDETDKR